MTHIQERELESLHYNRVVSAGDFSRSALEALVRQGLARKCWAGRAVTFRITAAGEACYATVALARKGKGTA
jgi:predicted MarR family transcription regulator